METLGPIFQARSRLPGAAALSPPTHAAAGVFYREVRQCAPQRNVRVCAPIANRLCALVCHSTPILLLPRPEVEPTALCFRLPLASDSPHTAPTHTSPPTTSPQQHVPADFNASKLFSLRPASGSSSSSSRRRRLVPRPRFVAPPRRDRLLHALEGLAKLSPMAHAMGFGARVGWVRVRLARVKAQPRSAYSPISRRAWPCGHGDCAAERRHVDHKGAQAFSSLIVVVAVELVDNLVSTRSCSSQVELPTSTSTNPL